jgi:hypothetical protein
VPGQLSVLCAYCGVSNQLAAAERALPAAPAYSPVPAVHVAAATGKSRVRVWVLVVGLGFAVVVLCVIAFGGVAGFSASSLSTALLEWYTPPCLVDANGDAALDLAGMSATPGSEQWKLRLVDGATGSVLWSENDYAPVNGVICASPRYFGVDGGDFRLRLFSAKALASPMTIPLSDHVDKLGLGDNCLLLKTADDAQKAVDLAGNSVARCDPPALTDAWGDWGVKSLDTERGLERTSGAKTFKLTYRSPGTPFLILTARAQDRDLWSKTLPLIKAGSNLAFVVTPGLLIVYGADPQDDHYGVLVGIDPETGTQRYAVRQDSHWSANFRSMHWNGRFVIIDWGFGLHAYDPSDGHRAWHIGGR